MNKALLLSCVAVWVVGGAERATAQESIPPRWEYKAVSFHDLGTAEATKLLNDLNEAGWDYVGPLANDLVSFRRVLVSAADVAAKKELERLQGTWATVSTEIDGQRRAEDKKTEKVVIAGNKWTIKIDGEVAQEGTFKIVEVAGQTLKVNFVVTDGFKQGDTWISIMQTDGDKMKWSGCYISENKARPKALPTREGDGYFLRTMRREKK